MQKERAEPVSSDLTVGFRSGDSSLMDLRSNPERQFKIGWPGWFAGDGGGGTRRSSLLRGGATRARRSSVLRVFLGLNQLGVWPGMINVERMIHPWQRLGSGRGFVAARAASGALRGGARRRVAL